MRGNLVNLTVNPCNMCMPLGAVTAFYGIKKSMTILHGSQGCSTYIRRHMATHYNEPIDIASSSLTEEGTVYGGEVNLKKGLKNLIQVYEPEVIGVATTCLAETIGEDINRIIDNFYKENPEYRSIKIIPVSTAGYAGTQFEGHMKALYSIVQNIEMVETKHDAINIITSSISPADTRYLKELLGMFSIQYILLPDISENLDDIYQSEYNRLPMHGTNIKDISKMAGSKMTIELSSFTDSKYSIAEYLYSNYGVPFHKCNLPISIRDNDQLIKVLAEITKQSIPEKLSKEHGRFKDAMIDSHKVNGQVKAAIYGEPDFVYSTVRMCVENGIMPLIVATGTKSSKFKELVEVEIKELADNYFYDSYKIFDEVDFQTIEENIRKMQVNVLIGNSDGRRISEKLGVPLVRRSFPIHDRVGGQRLSTLGYSGSLTFLDEISNGILSRIETGFRDSLYKKYFGDTKEEIQVKNIKGTLIKDDNKEQENNQIIQPSNHNTNLRSNDINTLENCNSNRKEQSGILDEHSDIPNSITEEFINEETFSEKNLIQKFKNEMTIDEKIKNEMTIDEKIKNEKTIDEKVKNEKTIDEEIMNKKTINEMFVEENTSEEKNIVRKTMDEKTKTHPCYNCGAHDYARMHLPIAPKCNISCNYCLRKYDCPNESRPGVTTTVLKPEEAYLKYLEVKKKVSNLSVVGIAGPGDALANFEETKETLRLIREQDKEVTFCLSTNGLMLPQYANDLIELGVSHITVTMNAIDPVIGAKIYSFVDYMGTRYYGETAATILMTNQLAGIRMLTEKGIICKVNIVMLKGINDYHIPTVVKKVKELGGTITNIMQMIPVKGSVFEDLPLVSNLEIMVMRKECGETMKQMYHCKQCRADAIGTLGNDISIEFNACHKETEIHSEIDVEQHKEKDSKENQEKGNENNIDKLHIAVATISGMVVDQHFGQVSEFYVYEYFAGNAVFKERRSVDKYCNGNEECDNNEDRISAIIKTIEDCNAVVAMRIGDAPKVKLQNQGIRVFTTYDRIEDSVKKIASEFKSNIERNN
ncbi:MAG: nifB [Anaerocolumna sp.]|nr:nifB [Anaerocolumna sp.]